VLVYHVVEYTSSYHPHWVSGSMLPLTHDGALESQELSKATSDAKNIVERVLKVRFHQKADPGSQ